MKFLPKFLIFVLLATLAIVGCSQQAAATPQTNDAQTAIANTMAVMQTQIGVAVSSTKAAEPTKTEVSTLAPTPTAEPTETMAPTADPTVAATATPVVITVPVSSGSTGPSYRVGDVVDLTIPDGTYVNTYMIFTKQWSLKNIGTGTWPADTKVVVADDNPFEASEMTIGQVVSPGQKVTIRLQLKAPESAGKFTGKFLLELPDGTRFGVGPNFDQPFYLMVYTH